MRFQLPGSSILFFFPTLNGEPGTCELTKTFRHKGLRNLYETGSQKGIRPEHLKCLTLVMARLDASKNPQDMNLPGLGLHPLKVLFEGFWAVSVSGNWRVIFRFEGDNAVDVDYIDYH